MRIVNEADVSEYRRYKYMINIKTQFIYFTYMISLPGGNEIRTKESSCPSYRRKAREWLAALVIKT